MLVSALITRITEDYMDDTLGLADGDSLAGETTLIRHIDEAEKEACRRMDLIYDETTSAVCEHTIVDGTRAYALDSRITKLERVTWNSIDLPKRVESEYEGSTWRTDEDDPTSYHVRGRTLYLQPIPDADAVSTSTTLYLAVYRMPLVDIDAVTDEPEIPSEFHLALIYWVLYRILSKRDEDINDPMGAPFYLNKFVEVFGPEVPADVRMHQFESPRVQTLRPKLGYQYTNTTAGDPDFDTIGWDS